MRRNASDESNLLEGNCVECGTTVAPGAGTLWLEWGDRVGTVAALRCRGCSRLVRA